MKRRHQDQLSRPSKPTTIHGFAQYGDLDALRKLLNDNPSLLNERNPVMAQTPLHVSAGYDRVDIVKFLLDWQGPEKIEMEAKNMYGETPLHMAAKNGCNEAARLLLVHGAFIEAKANNGMTPLHLAVWHTIRSDDYATVKTLLEYNADCSAEDNEGMTPIKHLSKGPGSEKLSELFHWHLEEQRKRRALEACGETKAKMSELENELLNIVGLDELKVQLRKWAKGMLLDERRRALGLKVGARRPPHMAFLGNPGTGKTMVARILGKLLHMVGILPTDKVTEVQRTDLVGEFVGHTGPKTRRKVQEAEGGILFVDEAYRLIPMQKADDKDYGLEALEEIMSVMDSGKIVVIFSGYSEPMKRVIASNEGFCRRVTKFFHFSDFNSEELAKILHIKKNHQTEESLLYGFKLHSSCSVDAIARLIEKESRMMLGKRSRQPIKRTTSMTGITVDVSDAEDVVDQHHQDSIISHLPPPQIHPMHESPDGTSLYDHRFLAMVSPRNPTSFTNRIVDSSTTDTASFLRACWLCNRRLAPGRDIYMYRGDTSFCSQECREKQMKQDERKEKLNINSSKKEDRHAHSSSTTTSSKTSKAKPVVAA